MYRFNSTLWLQLPRIVGLNKTDFYKEIGTSCVPFHFVAKSNDIRLSVLVNVCNRFHISIKQFITEDEADTMPSKIVIPKKEWTDIELRMDQLQQCYMNGIGGCSTQEFYKEIDYTPSNYGLYVRNAKETTLMLSNLLRVCNRWGFSPWNVIIDRNGEMTMNEIKSIMAAMEKRIAELEKAMKKMKKSR